MVSQIWGGELSEMFGEYKLLRKSDQLLNSGNTEALKFWAVYSKADNVHILDHLQKDL